MQSHTLEKRYDFRRVEGYWIKRWQELGVYKFDRKDKRRPVYSVDNPPSFSSGSLHMGHILNHTWIDISARYRRMRGHNVFFPIGYDTHGLPTELRVQYDLGVSKEEPEKFTRECIRLTRKNIQRMDEQYRSIGYSADWDLYYETMDEEYVKKVQLSLLMFHRRGLIYRGNFPVLWCPKCSTALAKAELGYVSRPGKLYHIELETTLGRHITIATTRPEMMGSCVAVFVHPDDQRYAEYVGKEAKLPIYDRKVPILAEEEVDMKFGTGVVYLCTFGDEGDVRWQVRYGLPSIIILDQDGVLNKNAGPYADLTIKEARERIVEDLKAMGRLVKEENLVHQVLSHTERSSCMTPIEFLPVPQWLIKVRPFKDRIIEGGKRIKWFPDFMMGRLTDWVESLDWDWIISRQRVFGTPIPFWYCEDCNEIIPARAEDLPVNPAVDSPPTDACPKCGSEKIVGAKDVCDCWIDSSITPLFVTGWEKDKELFGRTYPMTVRPQGYDIIRTWLFYTLFRCLFLTDKVPFEEALLNGMVMGPDNRKMSKSYGNVIGPDEVLTKYSADALRQWTTAAALGEDYPFTWERVEAGQRLLTKIWNASRFTATHLVGYKPKTKLEGLELSPLDHWILRRLDEVIEALTEDLDNYRFTTFSKIREFFWHEFCDHYLEAVKPRLYEPDRFGRASHNAAKFVLYTVLYNSLKLFAPFTPFITEEIYHKALGAPEGKSIHILKWPRPLKVADSKKAQIGGIIKDVIAEGRRLKSKSGIPLPVEIPLLTITAPAEEVAENIRRVRLEVARTLSAKEVKVLVGEVKGVSVKLGYKT